MLTVSHTCGRFNNKRCILIAFFPNSSNKEKAKAYLHGRLVGYALALISESGGRSNDDKKEFEQLQQAEEIAERKLMELWPLFETCATETGWKLDKTECATDGYEIYFE